MLMLSWKVPELPVFFRLPEVLVRGVRALPRPFFDLFGREVDAEGRLAIPDVTDLPCVPRRTSDPES